MKAIKLASVFAVSAVAAAVSTSTFAVEPVFSGTAGLSYNLESGAEASESEGEVNIKIDTGIVYVDLDMESSTNDGGFNLDEIYVKQGAVSFGDFDGSISDDAAFDAGTWEEGEYGDGSVTDLGIRYAAMDGLTLALEMQEGKDGVGAAVNYSAAMGALTLGFSAGTFDNQTDDVQTNNYSVGVKANVGQATLLASYSGGESASADFENAVVGADIAFTEAFSASLQFSADLENELDNTEVTLYYTAGDITYFATDLSGDADATTVGAYVSF